MMGPHSKLMGIEPKYLTGDKEAIKGFIESFDVSNRELLERVQLLLYPNAFSPTHFG